MPQNLSAQINAYTAILKAFFVFHLKMYRQYTMSKWGGIFHFGIISVGKETRGLPPARYGAPQNNQK